MHLSNNKATEKRFRIRLEKIKDSNGLKELTKSNQILNKFERLTNIDFCCIKHIYAENAAALMDIFSANKIRKNY